MLASIVTYAHAIVLGLPAILVLRHLGRLGRSSVHSTSFLTVLFPIAIFSLYSGIRSSSGLASLEGILLCGGLGLVAGIFAVGWWLVGSK